MSQEERQVTAPRDALARVRLGSGLSESSRDRLVGVAQVLERRAGAVLYREGDRTPYLAVVVEGRAGLRTHVPGRGDITLSTVEAGDILGWSVLVPPGRSHATVWAVTDVVLLVFPGESLRQVMAMDAKLAAAVYQFTLAALGRRLGATRLQMLDLFEGPPAFEVPRPRGALSKRLADVRREPSQGEWGT